MNEERKRLLTESARAIHREALTAAEKWPPFNSPHEGYAVILEELDEAWEEIKRNDRAAAIREMTQVGAMALRFVAEMQAAEDGA